MLCKGVDTTPCRDEHGVKEFLRAACTSQPYLPHEEKDSEDNSIADKCAPHDEMSKALTKMVGSTVAQSSDGTEQHLYPADDRQ